MSLESKFDKFFPPAPPYKTYSFRWNRKKRWYVWHYVIVPKKTKRYEHMKMMSRTLLENQESYMKGIGKITHAAMPTDLLQLIRANAVKSGIVFGEYLPIVDINTLPKEEQEFYKKHGKNYRINK